MLATLNLPSINLLAVLAAAAVIMLVGWIWYLPKVFGDAWSSLTGENLKPASRCKFTVFKDLFLHVLGFCRGFLRAIFCRYQLVHPVQEVCTVEFGKYTLCPLIHPDHGSPRACPRVPDLHPYRDICRFHTISREIYWYKNTP